MGSPVNNRRLKINQVWETRPQQLIFNNEKGGRILNVTLSTRSHRVLKIGNCQQLPEVTRASGELGQTGSYCLHRFPFLGHASWKESAHSNQILPNGLKYYVRTVYLTIAVVNDIWYGFPFVNFHVTNIFLFLGEFHQGDKDFIVRYFLFPKHRRFKPIVDWKQFPVVPSPGSHRKEFFLRVLRPYHHRRHHQRHRRHHHRHRRHHHPIH